MEWKEATFEEDYQEAVAAIEANSQYGRLPSREKKYMTAAEMGAFTIPKCKTVKNLMDEYIPLYGKEHWALSHYTKKCIVDQQLYYSSDWGYQIK